MKLRLIVFFLSLSGLAVAEGTQTWTQSSYEEFSKGTAKGVAIRSDGAIELAPAFKQLYTSPSTFVWAIAADKEGVVYIGTGSPARVYRVTADGKASIVFEPKELQVQALAMRDGVIYAATSPDGKVYKIAREKGAKREEKSPANEKPSEAAKAGSVPVDAAYSADVFFDPKTKYIWDVAFDPKGKGEMYVATGDKGEIYRVSSQGEGTVFFKSDEAHIRSLAFDKDGDLIAGSDGSGLVYRVAANGEGFVLYSAPRKEITSLAVDPNGVIYAAGIGEKRPAPTATPTSSSFTTQTQSSTGSTTQPAPTPPAPPYNPMASSGGAEIYAIEPDGSPRRLWTGKDDIVYALTFDAQGRLLAGTGNKGRIVAIEKNGRFTDLVKASASQVTGFAPAKEGLYAATSNLGKIFLLASKPESEGTFESEVFDAKIFSRWGRAEARGEGGYALFARSGNVDNPDRNWSPWKLVELNKQAMIDAPAARFLQWKAVLTPGNPHPGHLESVRLFYRSKNVAPMIDDVTVQQGSRSPSSARPSDSPSTASSASPSSPARGNISVRWTVRDENDDDLEYSVLYRGDGETRWKLLKEKIAEKTYSFDPALLPDGGYTVRVVASDAPSHTPDEALSDFRESSRFEVDTSAPRIDALAAKIENGEMHITFSATDTFSIVKRAEYSIDAGTWQFVEPVGQLADSPVETYDFSVPVAGAEETLRPKRAARRDEGASDPTAQLSGEHVVVVRVFDRLDNMATAKVVVK